MIWPIIISILIFIAIIGIGFLGYNAWQTFQSKKLQRERLERAISLQGQSFEPSVSEEDEGKTKDITTEEELRKDKRYSSIPWVNEVLKKILKSQITALVNLIDQAGLSIKVSEFLLISLIIGCLVATLVAFFFHIPFIGFAAGIMPFIYVRYLKEKRIFSFIQQMPPALDLLQGELKAGVDILTGLKHLAEEHDPPLCDEFGKLVAEVNLGVPVGEALNRLAERINTMDVQMLCTGITINREMGGNLAELIAKVSVTVRERFRLRGIVNALTAETKMSSILLLVLPVVMFVILNAMAPTTYNPFMKDPVGQKLILGCVVSMSLGFFLIKKMTHLDM